MQWRDVHTRLGKYLGTVVISSTLAPAFKNQSPSRRLGRFRASAFRRTTASVINTFAQLQALSLMRATRLSPLRTNIGLNTRACVRIRSEAETST